MRGGHHDAALRVLRKRGSLEGWGQQGERSATLCLRRTDSELLSIKKQVAGIVNEKKFQKVLHINVQGLAEVAPRLGL